ncbi:MAG: hypothetical protein GF330_13505, partial [Candidatus Eisenbacteria bacterium]|nr:hypothetical protein [Candidatus Eisenbacteria bacterium]
MADAHVSVRYVDPLARAWARSKGLLFRPFSFSLWFVLGFTAWLARLWENAGFWGSKSWRESIQVHDQDWGTHFHGHGDVDLTEMLGISGLAAGLVLLLIVGALVLAILIAWLSSRGEFMFLDNIVHLRSRISEPWRRLGRLADSLFLWRLAVQIAGGLLALMLILPGALMIAGIATGGAWRGVGVLGVIVLGLVGLAVAIAAALVNFWTDHCVVPIMYRYDLRILDGWRRFLPLLSAHPGSFVLFGLFYLVLSIAYGIAVFAFGLLTCCVGWLIVGIPYLGTVAQLPIFVTARALGPEFMAQFG